ncbi:MULTISPECIES: PAS domain-containing protein [unclassified Brevundimonas]|uniref:PAS domain-containing protein n=1 Tax=unclassified Brevundimonas TaxID=2622653 RepID=UPI001FD7DB23|nr:MULTISPECIES: PAS domain-containing protein [unclassified Brevundimonas]
MNETSPPPEWTEDQRLAALRAYDIVETDAEAAFDDITRLIAQICDAPIAVISFLEAHRQWFKSEVGLGVSETPLEVSFCAKALLQNDNLVVSDATQDERFVCNPLVTGDMNLRFYAGVLLRTAEGLPIGTLCVLDRQPRPQGLTALQQTALETLASQVMTQLELRRALTAKRHSDDAARRALAAVNSVGAWEWDIKSDRITADAAFAALYGMDAAQAAVGAPLEAFTAAIHPEDLDRVSAEIASAVAGAGDFVSEYRVIPGPDQMRWVLARGEVYRDQAGEPAYFPGLVIDITDRKKVEADLADIAAALGESEARFRAIADSMPQMVWSTRPDGFHDYYNARWYEFTGAPAGSTDGEGWNDMFHPEDQQRARTLWGHSLSTGEPYEIEYRLRHHSGVYRWTLGRAMAIRNADGEITRWFGTCTDIDDLKRMEQGKELLSQELSHRIKNIFAVVSALIALSARQHPEATAFAKALRTRVTALARAHEFVRPHTESSRPTVGTMTLHAFLEDLFRPYAEEDGRPRVMIGGEDAVFDDQAATSVALLFHELATNAAKYGALSLDAGRVTLNTRRVGDRFLLEWTETGGPPLDAAPSRAGFGSSLARVSVEGQLGGRLEQRWLREGLCVVADLPSTALSRRRAAERAL